MTKKHIRGFISAIDQGKYVEAREHLADATKDKIETSTALRAKEILDTINNKG